MSCSWPLLGREHKQQPLTGGDTTETTRWTLIEYFSLHLNIVLEIFHLTFHLRNKSNWVWGIQESQGRLINKNRVLSIHLPMSFLVMEAHKSGQLLGFNSIFQSGWKEWVTLRRGYKFMPPKKAMKKKGLIIYFCKGASKRKFLGRKWTKSSSSSPAV